MWIIQRQLTFLGHPVFRGLRLTAFESERSDCSPKMFDDIRRLINEIPEE